MSFLSRKPAGPDGRGGGAGADGEYDDYDLYAADGYHSADESWSPGEYFSPEGIKGRWAGENPEGRAGGRGQRDAGRGTADPSRNGYGNGFDPGYRDADRARGQAAGGAPRGGPQRGEAPRGEAPRDQAPRGDSFGSYGAAEYASGAYELPDGADEDRDRPDRARRKRRDRDDRTDWTGILRLRRDRGEDIWPDDGISDEDYWASVAADRPLTETGTAGDRGGQQSRPAQGQPAGAESRFGADQRGPALRGPDPRSPEPRGPEARGSDPRGAEQRGVTGRLGPAPGTAGGSQQGSAPGGGAAGAGAGSSWPGASPARPGTGAARSASGPNSFRPGTGAAPTVGVTVSRPPAGTGSMRSAAAGGPGTGASPAWPTKPQATGRSSGEFPAAAPRPSFQPNGYSGPASATASRPPQDRGDWGERTERIERVNLSGYPDQRAGGRGQGDSQPTGHNPVLSPGSSATARPSAPQAPTGPPASTGAHARGRDTGRADSGLRPSPDRREADRRPASRDSGHEAGGSIWSAAPQDTARSADEDPLTSTAYSRSALTEADGRSYRMAARRSQAQTKLTEQTESLATGEYQQSQRRHGRTGDYPAASYQPTGQRTSERGQQRGDQYPTDQYRGDQHRDSQYRDGQYRDGQYRDSDGGTAAQPATVRYPAYGSQQGQAAQQDRNQPADGGQPALGEPTAGQPVLGPSGTGPGYGQGSAAQYEPRQAQHRQPPPGPAGRNPYDTGSTGSYPYSGGQSHPAPATQAPAAQPAHDGTDDRYYQADQPRQDQGRPGYAPGYGAGRGRRGRPY